MERAGPDSDGAAQGLGFRPRPASCLVLPLVGTSIGSAHTERGRV